MSRLEHIRAEFVELMPKPILDGVVYVSTKYATASHNCCCGCGTRIVTPLKPSGWRVTMDHGEVTLYPSIGNWSAACQSHYWIEGGRVIWAQTYSRHQIELNRESDDRATENYYAQRSVKEDWWMRLWRAVKRWFT